MKKNIQFENIFQKNWENFEENFEKKKQNLKNIY